MPKSFLKNKSILITSGNSLVGKELINHFLLNKYKVIAVYRGKFKKKNINNLFQVKHNFVNNFISNKKVDVLINCIATHEFSKNKSLYDYNDSNVVSLIKIINFLKKRKNSLVINLSTISIKKQSKNSFTADNKNIDNSLLAITKSIGEQLLKQTNIKHINIRLPGVLVNDSKIKNRPWLLKIINDLIKNKKVKIYDYNKKFNSLIDVEEIFNFINHVIQKDRFKSTVNLSASGSMQLKDIIQLIVRKVKSKSIIDHKLTKNKKSSFVDISNTIKKFNYKPSSVKEIVERFLEDYIKQ